MNASIVGYDATSGLVTARLTTGELISAKVKIDFSAYLNQPAIVEGGVIVITPQPPVRIVTADPATVINGTLIYNTTAAALKVGNGGLWVAV